MISSYIYLHNGKWIALHANAAWAHLFIQTHMREDCLLKYTFWYETIASYMVLVIPMPKPEKKLRKNQNFKNQFQYHKPNRSWDHKLESDFSGKRPEK